MSNQIFRITYFSPLGFLQKIYPTPYCSICRGFLVDVCEVCSESNLIDCQVVENEKSFYHKHCFDMINTSNNKLDLVVKETAVPIHFYEDEDEDFD